MSTALVLYDAWAAALALADAKNPEQPTIICGERQLQILIHNNLQWAIFNLPGRHVPFVRGRITEAQVRTARHSYINAILIQSRGVLTAPPCAACLRPNGLRPFPRCVHAPGHFGSCCGNCKWRDHAARCSTAVAARRLALGGSDDTSDEDDNGGGGRGGRGGSSGSGEATLVPETHRLEAPPQPEQGSSEETAIVCFRGSYDHQPKALSRTP